MKKIKILVSLFIFSCVISAIGVKADHTRILNDIIIPTLAGTYTTSYYSKTVEGPQYAVKNTAIDSFSADERAVKARLAGVDNDCLWVTLPKGTITELHICTSRIGEMQGSFALQLRHVKVLATTSHFFGTWYLDDTGL